MKDSRYWADLVAKTQAEIQLTEKSLLRANTWLGRVQRKRSVDKRQRDCRLANALAQNRRIARRVLMLKSHLAYQLARLGATTDREADFYWRLFHPES